MTTDAARKEPSPAPWVSFKELRAKLRFGEVLGRYGVELKIKGERASGFCPLPTHEGRRRSPSFSVHLTKGIWQCFSCGAKGNVLDFAARMEKADPDDARQLREVALRLQERFGITTDGRSLPKAQTPPAQPKHPAIEQEMQPEPNDLPRVINPPMDFTLKNLDAGHPYLKGRGLTARTIKHFGLGYCHSGLMAGRIAIPLHNQRGELVGYAGRIVEDAKIDAQNPKYRFPGERQRDGRIIEFRKSLLLYNAHRVQAPAHELIVVEGFASVWWLWQQDYEHAVALMGSSCSDQQFELIVQLSDQRGRVLLFFDGDEAGQRCGRDLLERLSLHRAMQRIRLTNGRQPTDCDAKELAEYMGTPAQRSEKNGPSGEQLGSADAPRSSGDEATHSMGADV